MDREIKLFEIDNGKQNFTQRNNQYVFNNNFLHINSETTCNVTSMCMALDYLGCEFPSGEYSQPEDNLSKFLVESEEVNKFYEAKFPSLYKEYKAGSKDCYSPMELHDVLSYGTNLWIGKDITHFVEYPTEKFDNVLKFNIQNGTPLVVSGVFNGLNHIVCVTGIVTIDDKVEFVKIDDPYGNFRDNYNGSTGNDTWMTYAEATNILKPKKSDYKMYHYFTK